MNQTPTVRSIDLGRIGYEGLPSIARSSANLSLDFVDDNHVLFTFNPRGLVRRLPECPLTHQDHLIHAVLLEVPSGKVVKQADWYLHDTDRYLWPLGPGRFLLKKLNRLYVIDSSLQEKLLLDSPEEILWVSVTPDGRQIILERDGQPEIPQPDTQPATAEASKAKATVEFLDADSLAVQTSVGLKDIVRLEGTSFGYADVKHARRDDVWLVRFGPSPEQRHNITRIRSHCTPNVSYASNNTLLVGRCSWSSRDYNVTAFSTTGRRLWKKQWEQNRYNPAQKRNADGSRFAISTLKRSLTATDTAPPAGVDSGPSLDALRDLEQEIQVFDTASGTAVLTAEATPVVLDAQNFSLSPDGQQLAVLRDNKIEIHGLSRMAEDEKAKYAAVTKDGLGPYLFDTKNEGPDSAGQEALVQGQDVDEEEMAADGLKAALATPAQPQDGQTSADPIAAQIAGAKNPESTPPADGQEKPSITIRASTQVVAVDVVVTDNKGRPVSGLRAEDFQIAENGKRQNVNYFREVAGTEQPATSPRPAADMLTKLPPNVFTNQTSAEQEEGSLTVILLDLLNTQPMDREHGRDALLKFLKNKKTNQQIAVFTLGTSLQMIQGFTIDETLLASVVSGKKGSIHPFTPWMESNEALDRALGASEWVTARVIAQLPALAPEIIRTQIQMINQRRADDKYQAIDTRVRFTTDAFAQLARYLAGVPGRKNLLWLSGSFPSGIFPNMESLGFDSSMRHTQNYAGLIRQATNLMAESHVAVYPIDVRGQLAPPMFNADQNNDFTPLAPPPYLSGSVGDNTANMMGQATLAQQRRESSVAEPPTVFRAKLEEFNESQNGEHDTMDQLAADTGGKAFYTGNNIVAALENAAAHGSHYYALSYNPANKNYDGKFRTIKVSLARSGYKISHRRGYFADDQNSVAKELQREARDPVADGEAAAMQHGSPSSRQVFFATNVMPVGKHKRMTMPPASTSKKEGQSMEVQHYSLNYVIDLSKLHFRGTPEGLHHGVLDFMITSFDDDGKMLTSGVFKSNSDLTPERYAQLLNSGIRMHLEADIPTKASFMRLGVADVLSNRIGTVEFQLPVKVLQASKAYLGQALPEIEPD